jgi:hypothetical protein
MVLLIGKQYVQSTTSRLQYSRLETPHEYHCCSLMELDVRGQTTNTVLVLVLRTPDLVVNGSRMRTVVLVQVLDSTLSAWYAHFALYAGNRNYKYSFINVLNANTQLVSLEVSVTYDMYVRLLVIVLSNTTTRYQVPYDDR